MYHEVYKIIRATGQFIDDISARYFQKFHRNLPIISRIRFNNHITLGSAPTADFSILLLNICLTTCTPALGYQPEHGTIGAGKQQSLYLTARSLFSQIQASCSPTVPLIQAGVLLAMYEYTHGRPEDAFVTITGSARMAYATGINRQTQRIYPDRDLLLQDEEAANTWWGIVILER